MKTSHIKNRNMLMQVVLMIVTFGLYSIYWYYSTLKELHIANGKEEGAGKWTLLMVIPVLGYFATWHYSSECTRFSGNRIPTILMFLAWIVSAPIAWFIVQLDLNKAADAAAQPASA